MNYKQILSKKIRLRKAVVGIIGIGHVGGALGIGASKAGFRVIGFTRSKDRAEQVNRKRIKNYAATTDISSLPACDIICICVPTPVYQDKTPNLEPLESALEKTVRYLRAGQLVIIESTIAPGTTRNFVLPILKVSGLEAEHKFFLSYSPERVDPGNRKYTLKNTPKIVSGLGESSCALASEFYRYFIDTIVRVSTLEIAEMSKILENTFRFVNISLVNDLLVYTNKLGINLWETIAASATKPFGFLAHYPGPGIGGHCIPVDPYYLLDDAKKRGIPLKIIEHAGLVNDQQPVKVVQEALEILRRTCGKNKKSKILLIGVSYKPDISDVRESPALKIWELLQNNGHMVSYHDPYISNINGSASKTLSRNVINQHDLIIITTNHKSIDYQKLTKHKTLILDTRNVFASNKNVNVFHI